MCVSLKLSGGKKSPENLQLLPGNPFQLGPGPSILKHVEVIKLHLSLQAKREKLEGLYKDVLLKIHKVREFDWDGGTTIGNIWA